MKKYSVVLLLLCVSGFVMAQTTNYQVYALYVVNFAKYSSWPNANTELNVAVFGKTKVYEELLKQDGKVVNGHVLKVKQIEDVNALDQVHILYLADGKSGAIESVLAATQGKSILIVGEREGLYKKGAGLSFVIMENGTLRFDMNNGEIEKRNIKVAKNLSTLANTSI